MSTDLGQLPRILVIDDFFGRVFPAGRNEDRANLCAQYLLRDVTGDEEGRGRGQKILKPLAEAVFSRGQLPVCSKVGDHVENDLPGCLRLVEEGWSAIPGRRIWSLVLLDLCFYTGRVTKESDHANPGMPEGRPGDDAPDSYFGLQILRALQERYPELPVVILSSKPRESVSKAFTAGGALGFLDRSDPQSPQLLREYLLRHGLIPDPTGQIIGASKSLLLALRSARQMAENRRNVLIRGPRGSGKELMAAYINRHASAGDGKAPLVIVDSGTLSAQLYASELFGHKKGAFTGADQDREGRIVQAEGGDLFLDEIGNMPAEVQLGLLRVLEQREVVPIGGNRSRPVDVRFISATNEDIEERAATGRGFRLDLLDRLREGGTIILPALDERPEDIPLLVETFVREAEKKNPKAMTRAIDEMVLEKLVSYSWPGNIRELRQCIFNAVNRHPDVEHLVPVHLGLPTGRGAYMSEVSRDENAVIENRGVQEDRSLKTVLQVLQSFDFSELRRSELEGKLPEIQESCGEFVANYLKAALEATTKPVEGKVQIHPAIKMALGDASVSASKAADIIKGLLKGVEPVSDPVLKEAYDTALRLRPRRQNPGKGKEQKPA